MKSFSEKLKEARKQLWLTQSQLAEMLGLSTRSIISYENGTKRPHRSTLEKLAQALHVSVRYLIDDMCEDPNANSSEEVYIHKAKELFGAAGARDVESLLSANAALFAGGELSQEEKDAFFEAVMKAYIASKEEAQAKFGHKK